MQARQSTLGELIAGPETLLAIPCYQRKYRWGMEECSALLGDVKKVLSHHEVGTSGAKSDENQDHFIGTIVLQRSKANLDWLSIIDGQQRITTAMLLLRALQDVADQNTREYITEDYLIHKRWGDDRRYRLKPLDVDADIFYKIINPDREAGNDTVFDESDRDTHVYQNYEYFRTCIEQEQKGGVFDFEAFLNSILHLQIVRMELAPDESPQFVFATLNARGKALDESDLIRNHLMMDFDYVEQQKMYDNYWKHINEAFAKSSEFQAFLVHYAFARGKKQRVYVGKNANGKEIRLQIKVQTLYRVYERLLDVIEENVCKEKHPDNYKTLTKKERRETLMQDMWEYVQIYKEIQKNLVSRADLRLSSIVGLYTGLLAPSIMDCYHATSVVMYILHNAKYNAEVYTPEETLKLMRCLNTYALRRIVCRQSSGISGGFDDQISTTCCLSCLSEWTPESGMSLSEAMWERLSRQTGQRRRFFTDKEFAESLQVAEVYRRISKVAKYMLYLLDLNGNNAAELPPFTQGLSLEHIMPQSLSPEWESIIMKAGEIDAVADHAHRLGNLCLIAGQYNSAEGNRPFRQKRTRYSLSSFIETRVVGTSTSWTPSSIDIRGQRLSASILKLWPSDHRYIPVQPTSTKATMVEQSYTVSELAERLTDDANELQQDLTGWKPRFVALDEESARTCDGGWPSVLRNVVIICDATDSAAMSDAVDALVHESEPWIADASMDGVADWSQVGDTPYWVYRKRGERSTKLIQKICSLVEQFDQNTTGGIADELTITVSKTNSNTKGAKKAKK